jgi:hypothetical protein
MDHRPIRINALAGATCARQLAAVLLGGGLNLSFESGAEQTGQLDHSAVFMHATTAQLHAFNDALVDAVRAPVLTAVLRCDDRADVEVPGMPAGSASVIVEHRHVQQGPGRRNGKPAGFADVLELAAQLQSLAVRGDGS